MINVRQALKPEIDWINQCYDEVEFVHSSFDNEVIAVAEVEGKKAGIGRLVQVNSTSQELGGMYVFEDFRGIGIAGQIVKFLLERSSPLQTIYCIPFAHLSDFYQKSGFEICTNFEQVPAEILRKHLWCKEKYTHPVSLLHRIPSKPL
jgi:predicted GNAT family N-acyltransferase